MTISDKPSCIYPMIQPEGTCKVVIPGVIGHVSGNIYLTNISIVNQALQIHSMKKKAS